VSTPAGNGTSKRLAQWAGTVPVPASCLQLGAADNDSRRLAARGPSNGRSKPR